MLPVRTSSLPAKTSRPVIAGWRMSADQLVAASRYVTIDVDRIADILPWLAPGPANTAWRGYVSPLDDAAPDFGRLYFELALTISQFGGFIGKRLDGSPDIWKYQGSGVKALLATMAAIRQARLLPGIDIHDRYRERLACYFMGAPFARHRIHMMEELARTGGVAFFTRQLTAARRPDGSYSFNILHMAGLAQRFPLSFGGDAPFYKKASLLLLTMEIALNQLGAKAKALTLPPADYRIPQILEGLGVLRFSDDLSAKIRGGHVFRITDPEVRAIRAMTVEAVGHIKASYDQKHRTTKTTAELDGLLYLLSRNRPLMTRASMKPHMLVATAAF